MIVLAGDSYSTVVDFRTRQENILPHFSWAIEICKSHSAASLAAASSSMWDIYRQVKSAPWDLLLVNFTALCRFTVQVENTVHENTVNQKQLVEYNKQVISKIIKMPRTYCWSSFPDYRSYPGVEYIDMGEHDELYYIDWVNWDKNDKRPFHLITGNHFTREGNEQMINHMTRVIKERI